MFKFGAKKMKQMITNVFHTMPPLNFESIEFLLQSFFEGNPEALAVMDEHVQSLKDERRVQIDAIPDTLPAGFFDEINLD